MVHLQFINPAAAVASMAHAPTPLIELIVFRYHSLPWPKLRMPKMVSGSGHFHRIGSRESRFLVADF